MIKNENYVNIQGWMINQLNLSGNDLIVYAVIYGMSQDGESEFNGSLQYLADWCNCTKRGIQKNLNNLIEKGYITKFETYKNNQKFCSYRTVEQSSIVWNKVLPPMEQSSTNNKEDNKEKDISKDISTTTNFFGSAKKQSTVKTKMSLYDKCSNQIYSFTNNVELINSLFNFLNLLLEKSKSGNGSLYFNMFKAKLDKLHMLADSDSEKIEIVNKSVSRGWANFYALSDGNESNIRWKVDSVPLDITDEEF